MAPAIQGSVTGNRFFQEFSDRLLAINIACVGVSPQAEPCIAPRPSRGVTQQGPAGERRVSPADCAALSGEKPHPLPLDWTGVVVNLAQQNDSFLAGWDSRRVQGGGSAST